MDNKATGRRLPVDIEAKVLSMATCASMHKALLVFRAKSPLAYDLVMNKSNVVERIVQCSHQWHRKVGGGIEPATNTCAHRVGGLPKNAKVWCRLRTHARTLYVVGTISHCFHPLQYMDSWDGRLKQVGDARASVSVTPEDAANAGFVDEDADGADRSDSEETLADLQFRVRVVDMLPHVFANNAASATAQFCKVDAIRHGMAAALGLGKA